MGKSKAIVYRREKRILDVPMLSIECMWRITFGTLIMTLSVYLLGNNLETFHTIIIMVFGNGLLTHSTRSIGTFGILSSLFDCIYKRIGAVHTLEPGVSSLYFARSLHVLIIELTSCTCAYHCATHIMHLHIHIGLNVFFWRVRIHPLA